MYNRKDSYYLKAKEEGYKSRAAYKLKEINQKYRLIKRGNTVLDCGAAPGGWSQVALEIVGKAGKVVAVDYAEIIGITDGNFIFIQGDMYDDATITKLLDVSSEINSGADNSGYDVVLSDMAPKTTGIKLKDHVNSMELVKLALNMAERTLKTNGAFITKLFDGEDREELVREIKSKFTNVRSLRPDSTRKNSYELYVIATGFKGTPEI